MNPKRGRPAIKPSIKKLIYQKALKEKMMPRLAIAVELKNIIEEMGEIPPSEETMIRLISKARNHPQNPIDKPWSLGSITEYNITSEVIPIVMSILEKRLIQFGDLTIREALWVGRLYKVIELYKPKNIPPDVLNILQQGQWENENAWPVSKMKFKIEIEDLVYSWAQIYALEEQTSEIQSVNFDSRQLDEDLMLEIYNPYMAMRMNTIYEISGKYGVDHNALNDMYLSIEETEKLAKLWYNGRKVQNERSHKKKG